MSLNKSRLVELRTVGLRRRELPWSRPYCTRKKWLDFTLFPFYNTSQVYFLFILFPIEFILNFTILIVILLVQDSEFGFLYWSGQRSLVAAHWLSSTFDRESFLAWWGLIFTFFLVPKFGVLLSTTPPSTAKKLTFRPSKMMLGRVLSCTVSPFGVPFRLFSGANCQTSGVHWMYPLLFGGVKCFFLGPNSVEGHLNMLFDSLSRLQKTLHAKEPSDPTPGLSCRLAFSNLKIVKKRFWSCTKAL